MSRFVIKISYDGTAYGGWQRQKNSLSVQEVLEEAASGLFGKKTAIKASGRTDAGVHAAAQICHFDSTTSIPPEKIARALNVRLPQDISVLNSALAPAGFDCNKSAKCKTYAYNVYFSAARRPLLERYFVKISPPDVQKLQYVSGLFVGEHNFKAYSKSGSTAKTFVRTVYSVNVIPCNKDGEVLTFEVTGNGFLYNMVRTIVGTMLDYSSGRISEERILSSLQSGDRSLVGKTMPAKGLTLKCVDYGFELFKGQI